MLGIHDYWLFVATGVLLNLTPGQDTLGSGKPPSVRNTEARLLGALRHEFGDRVEVFCNGGPLR